MNPSELKRLNIRKAAFRRFREKGYYETTIDDICQEAGISKGSYYWHYSSKQEIFIDILHTWMREVVDELHTQFQDALQQPDYFSAITEAVVRETRRGRHTLPLLLEFSVQGLRDKEIQLALAQFYRRGRSAIAEILRPVLNDRLSDSEVDAVATTIFGAYSGLMIQDMCDPQASAQDTVRHLMTALRIWLRAARDGALSTSDAPLPISQPPEDSPVTQNESLKDDSDL